MRKYQKTFTTVAGLAMAGVLAFAGIPQGTPSLPSPSPLADSGSPASEVIVYGDVFAMGEDGTETSYTFKTVKKKCKIVVVLLNGKKVKKKVCKKPKPVASAPAPAPVTPAPTETPTPAPTETPTPAPTETPAPVQPAGEYSFLTIDSAGKPAHWNKCAPVRYRINPDGMTPSALDDVNEGLRRLSAASGIQFQYVGTTTTVPFSNPGWYDPFLKKENRDADLFIAFSNENVVSRLAGATVGLGGPIWADFDGAGGVEPQIIIGGLVLDTQHEITPGYGTGTTRGAVILHELGHMMNLGHVGDQNQMMFPALTEDTVSEYRGGDLAGFNALSSYPCFKS